MAAAAPTTSPPMRRCCRGRSAGRCAVQLTREQEHQWEPKGAAQVIDVAGALGRPGDSLAAYDFQTRYPSNAAPTCLALLLTGRVPPGSRPLLQMGDRTALPSPTTTRNLRVTVHDMAPIVRASWLRGVPAMLNIFAHESFINKPPSRPAPTRSRSACAISPTRAPPSLKTRATADERAGWTPLAPAPAGAEADGRRMVRGPAAMSAPLCPRRKWPGVGAAWSAPGWPTWRSTARPARSASPGSSSARTTA